MTITRHRAVAAMFAAALFVEIIGAILALSMLVSVATRKQTPDDLSGA